MFHACRTATSLHHHWVLMGHYNLLNDQKGQLAISFVHLGPKLITGLAHHNYCSTTKKLLNACFSFEIGRS